MKILFVCPFVPWPLVNGGKIRTYHLLREASAHVEIHLRAIREPEAIEGATEALQPWCASLSFFERSRPTPWQRWKLPKLERWFHSQSLVDAVRSDLRTGDFRLVHLDELLLARIVPPKRAVPVVQHHHKLDTVLYDSLRENEGPRRHFDLWKLRRLEAESARRYRHHVLCSTQDAEILRQRHGALDCAVVPSGFDPDTFRPSDPPLAREPDRLVFLGSMDYGPNVDGVLFFAREILPLVRARRPAVCFEIVGGNPPAEVRALAGGGVHVTGRVPLVQPYLERAGALVVPLRIGGGTRLKIVEALALGTPVVATSVGAEGLGLVSGEHLDLADSAADFANAVVRLIEDRSRASNLARAGRAFVHERYRWQVLGEALVDTWERVAFSGTLSPSR